jgi:hypothetical protein
MMRAPETMSKFLRDQEYCVVQTEEQQGKEEHLKQLRQGQRERRKLHMKQIKGKPSTLTKPESSITGVP